MDLALFVLRAVVGLFFAGHGAQKLFGAFGGHGIAGTGQFFESIGMRPGPLQARAAGGAELVGGLLLFLGLFTPLAATMIISVMVVAIVTVHAKNGPWVTESGWEYNAVLIAAVTALADTGPGDLSLDHLLGTERSGPLWAVAALGTGVGTAFLTMALGRRGRLAAAAGPSSTAVEAAHGDTAGDPTTAGA
jgi:putative oxidoreductase